MVMESVEGRRLRMACGPMPKSSPLAATQKTFFTSSSMPSRNYLTSNMDHTSCFKIPPEESLIIDLRKASYVKDALLALQNIDRGC